MNSDEMDPQSSTSDGYISFVAHIWVGDDGELIRGTIEDAHTGARLAIDLSELVAFLKASLVHSPGQAWNMPTEGDENMSLERPSYGLGEGLSDVQDYRERHDETK